MRLITKKTCHISHVGLHVDSARQGILAPPAGRRTGLAGRERDRRQVRSACRLCRENKGESAVVSTARSSFRDCPGPRTPWTPAL